MSLEMFQKRSPTILAVASGKGGVGKSTVAVNLAIALKEKGFKVGLLDTDLYGPSVRRMLPEDRMPSQQGETIIPALCRGIRMISMAYFRKEHEAAVMRAPIANNILTQFLNNVDWGPLDYLVIDFPPGTGDIQLTLSQQAALTGAILVTTPQEVSVMDVRKAAHLFHQVQVPIIGIVENMSYYGPDKVALFGKGGGERLAAEIGVPLLETFPLDPEVGQRADQGQSVFDAPQTLLAQGCDSLADKVISYLKKASEVKNLSLPSPGLLLIEWADGAKSEWRLSELQKNCPCAQCAEEKGKVDEAVTADEIVSVGRYALRIRFTSGCSNGIYRLDQLRVPI